MQRKKNNDILKKICHFETDRRKQEMGKTARQDSLSNLELSAFCEQMAMILRAGISVIEGISIMKEDAQTAAEQELLGIKIGRAHV